MPGTASRDLPIPHHKWWWLGLVLLLPLLNWWLYLRGYNVSLPYIDANRADNS